MPTFMTPDRRKLGRLPSPPDSRTLQLRRYLAFEPVMPPRSCDTAPTIVAPPTWSNTRYGDCTVAARANQCLVEDCAHAAAPILDPQLVIDEYFELTQNHDTGLSMRVALNHWRKSPFLNTRPIHAYAAIDPVSSYQVRQAIYTFGSSFIALNLPTAWRGAHLWTRGIGHAYAPGSWGAHCVALIAYDPDTVVALTWGARQPITWSALAYYCDEAYAVLGPDWSDINMPSPRGIDLDMLRADLAAIDTEPTPED